MPNQESSHASSGKGKSKKGKKANRASIRDVAELAGVSIGTVSNTLNRPQTVRKPTREAVEKAIRDLNFTPNPHARVLSGSASQLIGLIVLDVRSPFFMEVAHAVEKVASMNDHVVVVASSENSEAKEQQLLKMLAAQQVRGVLLSPATAGPFPPTAPVAEAEVPTVYVDCHMGPDHCCVSVDHVAGARLATRHLLDLGHRQIAFVGDSTQLHQFDDRLTGVRQGLAERGLDPAESLIEIRPPGLGMQDGLLAGAELLDLGLPTGILCGNDMMAFGVYRALATAGVEVGKEVALIGYDDVDFAADWVLPLTSVRQPTSEMGQVAAQLLLEHTSGDPNHQHQQVVLRPELVIRESSGKPRN